MRDVHQSENVGLQHPPPVLGIGALDGTQQHDTGVVDHDVQATQLADTAVDSSLAGRLVRDVELDNDDLSTYGLQPGLERLEPVNPAGGKHDRRPLSGKCDGGRLTDAARRPRDERDLALQTLCHGAPPMGQGRHFNVRPRSRARCTSATTRGRPSWRYIDHHRAGRRSFLDVDLRMFCRI